MKHCPDSSISKVSTYTAPKTTVASSSAKNLPSTTEDRQKELREVGNKTCSPLEVGTTHAACLRQLMPVCIAADKMRADDEILSQEEKLNILKFSIEFVQLEFDYLGSRVIGSSAVV